MKIGFFTSRLIYGGGEKVQNWLASQIIDAGHEVVYLTPVVDGIYEDKLIKIGLKGKVEVCQYPWHKKKRHPRLYIKAMRRIYQKFALDAILIFGGSLMEEIAARQIGVKVILSERSNPGWRSFPSQILKKIQYSIADGYVFQTIEQANYYHSCLHNNYEIILNPVIDSLPNPISSRRKEIVTVGRLSKKKNIFGVLNAYKKFYKTHQDYKLLIYGSGPLENAIYEFVNENNLSQAVSIIKGKSNIVELINGASLFVFNSTNEGMPNALIEAMCMGLPCISSDCPIYGPRTLIKEGENGFLVPVKDDDALYDKMCMVIDNPSLAKKIGNEAVKTRDKLNQNIIAQKWINFLQRIIIN